GLEAVGHLAGLVEPAWLRLVDRRGHGSPRRGDGPDDSLLLRLNGDVPDGLRTLKAPDGGLAGLGRHLVELLELVVLDEPQVGQRLLPHAWHGSSLSSGRRPFAEQGRS